MTVVSNKYRFVYFPIPKNGTSSVKRAFYQLETNRLWDEDSKGLGVNIHGVYPTQAQYSWLKQYDRYQSLVILREPIKRFISAYKNRVVDSGVLKDERVRQILIKKGLTDSPDIDEFIDRFQEYCSASRVIRLHTLPQHEYVGDFIDRVSYKLLLNEVQELGEILTNIAGRHISVPHKQSSRHVGDISIDSLSTKQLNKLESFYKNDLIMLEKYKYR